MLQLDKTEVHCTFAHKTSQHRQHCFVYCMALYAMQTQRMLLWFCL